MRFLAIAAILAAGATSLAHAQPYDARRGGAPRATLYQFPNFQGRQLTVTDSVTNLPRDFNDVAMSARFEGDWRICENSDFGGRCATVRGDVPDLAPLGLTARVSSLEPDFGGAGQGGWSGGDRRPPGGGYGDDRYPGGGGYGGGDYGADRGERGGRSFEGSGTVFFPTLRMSGYDIVVGGGAANAFCRSRGLGPAAWFDAGERVREAMDVTGRRVRDAAVLRDVLCRK